MKEENKRKKNANNCNYTQLSKKIEEEKELQVVAVSSTHKQKARLKRGLMKNEAKNKTKKIERKRDLEEKIQQKRKEETRA